MGRDFFDEKKISFCAIHSKVRSRITSPVFQFGFGLNYIGLNYTPISCVVDVKR